MQYSHTECVCKLPLYHTPSHDTHTHSPTHTPSCLIHVHTTTPCHTHTLTPSPHSLSTMLPQRGTCLSSKHSWGLVPRWTSCVISGKLLPPLPTPMVTQPWLIYWRMQHPQREPRLSPPPSLPTLCLAVLTPMEECWKPSLGKQENLFSL